MTKLLLVVLVLFMVLFSKVQAQCHHYEHRLYCSNVTFEEGNPLPRNSENQNVMEIVFEGSSITSVPSQTFIEFNNAEIIKIHIGALDLDPAAFDGVENLKELNLDRNKFVGITTTVLTNLLRLEKLILSHNEISEINPENLKLPSNLIELDLSHNKIEVIKLGTFDLLSNLVTLNLQDNKVTKIQSGTLNPLINLRKLNLNRNHLHNLEKKSFKGLVNLQYLYLRINQIKNLNKDDFEDLSKLMELDLSDNLLTKFEPETFKNLPNLLCLKLSNNQLTNIARNDFNYLRKLKVLNLDGNRLLSFEMESILFHPSDLVNITLNNNPWLCDFLENFIEAFENLQITIVDRNTAGSTNVYGLHCEYPERKTNTISDSEFNPDRNNTNPLEKIGNENKIFSNIAILTIVLLSTIIVILVFASVFLYRRSNITWKVGQGNN